MEQSTSPSLIWPFIVYFAAVVALVVGMITLSYFIGERHLGRAKGKPFEAGIKPTGSAQMQFPIHFYLVALFFVIFDLEAVFIFTWAISFEETGWRGYFILLVFVAELLILLIYLWKTGALDFGTDGRTVLKAYHKKINAIQDEMVDH